MWCRARRWRRFEVELSDEYSNVEFTGKDIRNWQKTNGGYVVQLHTPVAGAYTLLATYDRPFKAQGETLALHRRAPPGRPIRAGLHAGDQRLSVRGQPHRCFPRPAAVGAGGSAARIPALLRRADSGGVSLQLAALQFATRAQARWRREIRSARSWTALPSKPAFPRRDRR